MLAAQKLNAFAKIDLGKRMLWARSEAVNRIDLFGSEKVKMHPPLSGCDKRKAGEIADVFPELKNGFVAAVPGVNVDDAQTGPAEMDAEIGVALLDQPTNLIGLQVVRTVPPLHAGAFANPAGIGSLGTLNVLEFEAVSPSPPWGPCAGTTERLIVSIITTQCSYCDAFEPERSICTSTTRRQYP